MFLFFSVVSCWYEKLSIDAKDYCKNIGCSVFSFIIGKGPSINYIITSEGGGGGCEMMMVDDGRGDGP